MRGINGRLINYPVVLLMNSFNNNNLILKKKKLIRCIQRINNQPINDIAMQGKGNK